MNKIKHSGTEKHGERGCFSLVREGSSEDMTVQLRPE